MFDGRRAKATAMALEQIRLVVRTLEVESLTGPESVRLLDVFAELERLGAAGKALVAGRAAETNQWRGGTDRSAADWLANRTGTTAGEARKALGTAEQVKRLPRSEEALRSGTLSLDQAAAVTDGAAADPSAEEELLTAASTESVRELRGRAERIKAAALADDAARHEAIRRRRSAREWIGEDGAWNLHLRGTKDAGARFMARMRPHVDRVFKQARQEGRREPLDAYAFDGAMAMAEASGSGDGKAVSPVKVILRADLPAMLRGETEPGEVCEISGYGPIPVDVARELLPGSFLTLVLTKGVGVANVTHLGRQFTAHQQTAMEWSDDQCQVLGCAEHQRLQRDHRTEWSITHHTRTDDADRLCRWHHWLKTTMGFRLEPGEGKRRMVAAGELVGAGPP